MLRTWQIIVVKVNSVPRKIGNRGPLRLNAQGRLHSDILDAYWQHGFYIFEGVIDRAEIDELRADSNNMIARAPVRPDAKVDKLGRPALGLNCAKDIYRLIKPFIRPLGRHAIIGRTTSSYHAAAYCREQLS